MSNENLKSVTMSLMCAFFFIFAIVLPMLVASMNSIALSLQIMRDKQNFESYKTLAGINTKIVY